MTISTIMSNAAPAGPFRSSRVGEERRGVAGGADSMDRVSVSGEAKAMYEAGRSQNLDVIRERVRRGYYLDGYVTEQVVDIVAREIEASLGR